ncbi:MAG: universal stress protein [Firmicutes bacterium]|nr:universal stress protein [Bacillota bacterium]
MAIDGCAPSLGAAKKAIELAERYGAEVIVLYVEEKTPT